MGSRLSLTTRGAFALGVAPSSAIAGFILGAEELVLLSVALFALLACGLVQCSARARVARSGWHIAVHLPSSEVEAGQELSMMVVLSASGRSGSVPTWLEDPARHWRRVRKANPPDTRRTLPNPSLARPLPRLAEGETVAIACAPPTQHRGVFTLRGLRHWCFDSVGLFAQVLNISPTATITVFPVPVDAGLEDELLQGEEVHATTGTEPIAGPARRQSSGDFAGLRPYVPGDRLRLLYWPALARSGDLVVRDFEDIVPSRVYLVVDVRPELGAPGSEAALAVAAGIGLQVLSRGTMLELTTSAGDRVAIGPGTQGASALLRAIAAVDVLPAPIARRRRGMANAPDQRGFPPSSGTPLVVTTGVGAGTLPKSFGFRQLIIAA
jgi:uncharacterized protein (DUF58 family)